MLKGPLSFQLPLLCLATKSRHISESDSSPCNMSRNSFAPYIWRLIYLSLLGHAMLTWPNRSIRQAVARWTLFAPNRELFWETSVVIFPPFPLLLLMMESQACLYMKCPENICSEGFRPWITIAFLKRKKKSRERESEQERGWTNLLTLELIEQNESCRDETWLQSKRYRRLCERQKKREMAGLKGQMKLVPSGHSDWSFYRVADALGECQQRGCWHRELSISPTELFKVSVLIVTEPFEKNTEGRGLSFTFRGCFSPSLNPFQGAFIVIVSFFLVDACHNAKTPSNTSKCENVGIVVVYMQPLQSFFQAQ